MSKRFKNSVKKEFSYYINPFYDYMNGKKYRGREITKHMIRNWIYGLNENKMLEEKFEQFLLECAEEEISEEMFYHTEETDVLA